MYSFLWYIFTPSNDYSTTSSSNLPNISSCKIFDETIHAALYGTCKSGEMLGVNSHCSLGCIVIEVDVLGKTCRVEALDNIPSERTCTAVFTSFQNETNKKFGLFSSSNYLDPREVYRQANECIEAPSNRES